MNNKLLRLRISNKKLKNELKKCKMDKDQRNEIKYLENENKEYASRLYDLDQENSELERDLEFWIMKARDSDELLSNHKDLSKKYEENVSRLSIKVAKLTKENENFKSKGIANKLKNIFKKR